jgi:hypothetical protein
VKTKIDKPGADVGRVEIFATKSVDETIHRQSTSEWERGLIRAGCFRRPERT